ncbi:MAG: NAD-dependent epimerase/dehydratase family protein [Chloroflexi bacterium]|nr:MAG: NAD-dependent epimerase/dehydratase family protein [Chloroflexota bacterium]
MLAAVTGAEGFIGSHLVEALVARGARVRAMVLYNSFNSWGWLETLPSTVLDEVEVVLSDVRDASAVLEFLRGADVVYHLAALIAIPYSYRAPSSYLETNARGTLNVLEAARQLETPRVVHTSTSEVYGTARQVPIDERHPLQAQSPYAASKIAGDKLVESFHLSFGLPVVTLRPFNTFGPRQSARAVIPTIISQIAAGKPSVHLGATAPTRDFTFVSDTAAAYLAVATAGSEAVVGRTLNAGTGTEISIGAVATLIGQLMDRTIEVVQDPERLRPDASEVMRLVSDSSQLRALTGWQPEHSFEDGLRDTIRWFTDPENLARYKVDLFTL